MPSQLRLGWALGVPEVNLPLCVLTQSGDEWSSLWDQLVSVTAEKPGQGWQETGCSRQREQPLQKLRRENRSSLLGPTAEGPESRIDPPATRGKF